MKSGVEIEPRAVKWGTRSRGGGGGGEYRRSPPVRRPAALSAEEPEGPPGRTGAASRQREVAAEDYDHT